MGTPTGLISSSQGDYEDSSQRVTGKALRTMPPQSKLHRELAFTITLAIITTTVCNLSSMEWGGIISEDSFPSCSDPGGGVLPHWMSLGKTLLLSGALGSYLLSEVLGLKP